MVALAVTVAALVFAVIGGCESTVQTGANATLGRFTSRGFAGMISICTSVVCVSLFYALDTYAVGTTKPDPSKFKEVPWWAWTGGIHGIIYVLSAIICAPTLGAGTFTGISVCSMLITALLLDHFGLIGFARKHIPWQKVLGALLMLAGVVLMTAYTGRPVEAADQEPAVQPAAELVSTKQPAVAAAAGQP